MFGWIGNAAGPVCSTGDAGEAAEVLAGIAANGGLKIGPGAGGSETGATERVRGADHDEPSQ